MCDQLNWCDSDTQLPLSGYSCANFIIRKIANLLTKLRRDGQIRNIGTRTNPIWALADQGSRVTATFLQSRNGPLGCRKTERI